MQTLQVLFWSSLAVVIYSFVGSHIIQWTTFRVKARRQQEGMKESSASASWVNPFLLLLMFMLNIPLVLTQHIYLLTMAVQFWFYAAAFAGYALVENRQIQIKALFIPYNFCVHNYTIVIGMLNHFKEDEPKVWETNAPLKKLSGEQLRLRA